MAAALFTEINKKPHRRLGSGVANLATKLEPNCRAVQQRVRKQQVQVAIHGGNVATRGGVVNWISGATSRLKAKARRREEIELKGRIKWDLPMDQ